MDFNNRFDAIEFMLIVAKQYQLYTWGAGEYSVYMVEINVHFR